MNFKEARDLLVAGNAKQNYSETYQFTQYFAGKFISYVVEIGMGKGGVCALFKKVFPTSRVIGVDILPIDEPTKYLSEKVGFDYVVGDSHKEETLNTVLEKLGTNKIDILFIDGDHTYEGLKRDWELWSPKAKYVAIHDIYTQMEGIDVPRFWKEIIKKYKNHKEWGEPKREGIGLLWNLI